MSEPSQTAKSHDAGIVLDSVQELVAQRIRELEAEGAKTAATKTLTIGDGIALLGNFERIDELREMADRISLFAFERFGHETERPIEAPVPEVE